MSNDWQGTDEAGVPPYVFTSFPDEQRAELQGFVLALFAGQLNPERQSSVNAKKLCGYGCASYARVDADTTFCYGLSVKNSVAEGETVAVPSGEVMQVYGEYTVEGEVFADCGNFVLL